MSKIITATLILIASFCNIYGQSEFTPVKDKQSLISQLDRTGKTTLSIEADFTQKKHIDILEEVIESTGHFYFKKENKIRWEYFSPYKYLIIINGDNIYINDDNKESNFDANSNKAFKQMNKIISSSLQGKILHDENDFQFEYLINSNFYLVKLTPVNKNVKSFLNKIEMYFNKKTYSVDKIIMREASGDYTIIEFNNKKLNEKIPENIFDSN